MLATRGSGKVTTMEARANKANGISTLAERQAENKKKLDNTSKNNQNKQQQDKRQNTGKAYTARHREKKHYVPEHTTVETPMNMSLENKAHFESEKRSDHLIMTGIGDEIYSTVDACQTAQETWEAIKKLQQVNVRFLQQLQPEWSRFVTIVKQQHKLDEVSYHKLFDILKKSRPILPNIKVSKIICSIIKTSIPTRSHTTTRYKGKEIAKPITPPSESASEEDSDPKQAQKDKDMQNYLALIAKYYKRIYKPTNLRTSLNSRNKNVDTTLRYKNANQSGQFGNQRTMNVAGARENICSPVVQQSGTRCFNCKEFGHFAKECRKPKKVKDSAYHKEKMLLCKQAKDVPTADLGTDFEPLEKVQNGTGYNVFANELQHSEQSESISNTCLVEMDDSNVIPNSPNMCDDDIQNDQNDVENNDERVVLANLITNLKLDVDENKKI
nr:hypothetical protein [Tanacetum cinerariifolium]